MPKRKKIDESENEVIENLDVDAEAGSLGADYEQDTGPEIYDTRLLPGGELVEEGEPIIWLEGKSISESMLEVAKPVQLSPYEGCSVWGSWRGGPECWWEVTDGKLVRVFDSWHLSPSKPRLDHIIGNKIPDEMELA